MPITKGSTGLTIDLAKSDRLFYFPGDVVSGKLIYKINDGVRIGQVSISCYGRAKVKIQEQTGSSYMTFRSRIIFFNIEQELDDNRRSRTSDSYEWPFSLTLPHSIDPNLFDRHGLADSRLFQPNNNLAHPLPPRNVYFERHLTGTLGRATWGAVEYSLEAKVRSPPSSSGKERGEKSVIKQIPFEPLFAPGPLDDYKLSKQQTAITFKSPRLLAESTGSKLFGFRDRARSTFKSDSVPQLTIDTTVHFPTVLQPYHPLTDPLMISASYNIDPRLTTIDVTPKNLPQVFIKSVKVHVYAHSTVRAYASPVRGDLIDGKVYKVAVTNVKDLNTPLPLAKDGDRPNIIDLGTLCKIKLTGGQVGQTQEWPLTPTFATWNITRWYKLEWEIGLQCGDKLEILSNTKNMALLVIAPAVPDEEMNPDRSLAPEYEEEAAGSARSSDEVLDRLFHHTSLGDERTSTSGQPRTKAEIVAEEHAEQRRREAARAESDTNRGGTSTVRGPPSGNNNDDVLPRYEP